MNKIFEYKLENIDQQTIYMPLPARILSVIEQDDDIVLCSIVDDSKDVPKIPVDILIKGTGDVVEDNTGLYTFLGTVKLFENKDYEECWHVFYMYTEHDHIIRQSDKLEEPIVDQFRSEFPNRYDVLVA